MSVINKMLRDLDQRQAKTNASAAPQASHSGLQAGTSVLGDYHKAAAQASGAIPRYARFVRLILACTVLALIIGAAWWMAQRVAPSTDLVGAGTVVAAAPAAPAVLAQPAASLPVAVEPLVAPLVAAAVSTPALPQSPIPAKPDRMALALPLVAMPTPTPAALTAASTASAKRESTSLGLRMETTLTLSKLAELVAAPERAPVQASELPKGPTPNEALERAQALWHTGSRDAAIDLLQDAVAVAERAGAGSSFAQGNPVLLPLVRELTRMQLAESRHGAVWDLLTRLEPQLGAASDLWAIRGNAAQRLGRHQDSVLGYMAALQSRPNEQRWLLGAAVSLAALGQTSSAAEMAEKARAVGVVSPEVLAYLRQMGVTLKDK